MIFYLEADGKEIEMNMKQAKELKQKVSRWESSGNKDADLSTSTRVHLGYSKKLGNFLRKKKLSIGSLNGCPAWSASEYLYNILCELDSAGLICSNVEGFYLPMRKVITLCSIFPGATFRCISEKDQKDTAANFTGPFRKKEKAKAQRKDYI